MSCCRWSGRWSGILLSALLCSSVFVVPACKAELGINCEVDEDCVAFEKESGEPYVCSLQTCIPKAVYCERDPDKPGCRNGCGGVNDIDDERSVGDGCGQCNDGVVACQDLDDVSCRYEPPLNECGGCSTLLFAPGTTCGACGDGVWACDTGSLTCSGATAVNACGGCQKLVDDGGHALDPGSVRVCQTDDGTQGIIACLGPDRAGCISFDGTDGFNLCGGDEEIDGIPTAPCGVCEAGRFACQSDGESVVCDLPSDALNACGGCAPLLGDPGDTCGDTDAGEWACSGDEERVICDEDRNACGGLVDLELVCPDGMSCDPSRLVPGIPCGRGLVTYCVDESTLSCAAPPISLCGGRVGAAELDQGTALVGEPPGTSCGACGDGVYLCIAPNRTECIGASETNLCGGCSVLRGEPGTICAFNHTWQCDGNNVACRPSQPLGCEAAACGGGDGCCGAGCSAGDDVDCLPGRPTGVAATVGTETGFVHVTWQPVAGAGSYIVRRSGQLVAEVEAISYDDFDAAPPVIISGALSASDRTRHDGVELAATGVQVTEGLAAIYTVAARSPAGLSPFSSPAEGHRGAEALTIAWEKRDSGDLEFESLGFFGADVLDTSAPIGGEAREYRARVSADGAESVVTETVIGARATCADELVNGDEAGIDCGGSCGGTCAQPTFAEGSTVEVTNFRMRELSYVPSIEEIEGSGRKSLDEYAFTTPNLPSWISLNAVTGELTGLPNSANMGESTVRLELRRGSVAGSVLATQEVVVTVREERVVDVEAGFVHACAILESGAVRCWGENTVNLEGFSNFRGILGYGHGRSTNSYEPAGVFADVQLGAPAVDLCVGLTHTCAVLDDGTARCWGTNEAGQLGTGMGVDQVIGDDEVPTDVPALQFSSNITSVECGEKHTCAIAETGDVYCWGNNGSDALNLGGSADVTSGKLGVPSAELIVGDDEAATALDAVSIGGAAIDVCAAANHSCAVRADGRVVCWGRNEYGQLGTGTLATVGDDEGPAAGGLITLPVLAKSIECANVNTCALTSDGEAYCWGAGLDFGSMITGDPDNLGDDEVLATLAPIPLGKGWERLYFDTVGATACVANSGAVRCWGQPVEHLQRKIGDDESIAEAEQLLVRTTDVALTFSEHFVVEENGALSRFYGTGAAPPISPDRGDRAFELGSRTRLSLGDQRPIPFDDPSPNILSGAYYEYELAFPNDGDQMEVEVLVIPDWLTFDGSVISGVAPNEEYREDVLQLRFSDGQNVETLFHTIEISREPEIVDIDCNMPNPTSCCAITSRDELRCWGDGGPNGKDLPQNAFSPEKSQLIPLAFVPTAIVNQCVFGANGEAQCWGADRNGRRGDGVAGYLGDDELLSSVAPLEFGGETIAVDSNQDHSCMLLSEDRLACWGRNRRGQLARGNRTYLGDDERADSVAPIQLPSAGFDLLAIGYFHTCVGQSATGEVRCWGLADRLGVLGEENIGDDPGEVVGAELQLGQGIVELEAGRAHTCALFDNGKMICWGGMNSNGELGPLIPVGIVPEVRADGLDAYNYGQPISDIEVIGDATLGSSSASMHYVGPLNAMQFLERQGFYGEGGIEPYPEFTPLLRLSITSAGRILTKMTATGLVVSRASGQLELFGNHLWRCASENNGCRRAARDPHVRFVDVD